MAEFSSRRHTISALTARLAAEFAAQHGHAPDARALGNLRQWANHASRLGKPGEPLDLAAAARRWAAQARTGDAGALEPVMPAVTTRRGPAEPAPEPGAEPGSEPAPAVARADEPTPAPGLTPEQARDVMGQALARLQESQPAWRKADLVRHLGELLPDDVACPDDRPPPPC